MKLYYIQTKTREGDSVFVNNLLVHAGTEKSAQDKAMEISAQTLLIGEVRISITKEITNVNEHAIHLGSSWEFGA